MIDFVQETLNWLILFRKCWIDWFSSGNDELVYFFQEMLNWLIFSGNGEFIDLVQEMLNWLILFRKWWIYWFCSGNVELVDFVQETWFLLFMLENSGTAAIPRKIFFANLIIAFLKKALKKWCWSASDPPFPQPQLFHQKITFISGVFCKATNFLSGP